MAIEPGQTLLHYRLVEKIGEGGMGVVWKAIDTTLDRPVAIKLLPASFADEPDRLARFEREAKLLAALNHPNIASIFSVHQAEGEHFIALELVEGEDLATGTAAGPLPLEDALRVCVSIAEALEAAHQAGVVHRDLKPANVKLGSDGKVKVLDFGLAKAVDPQTTSGGTSPTFAPTVTSAGTRAGVLLGTAAYMSPEQARGRPMDQRTDLWSFGCVLYECLTGHVLFAGETVSDTLAAILRKDPDWSRLPAGTPANIRTLLKRCLTRDASRRLHSASDARIELLEAIEHPEGDLELPTATAATAPRRRQLGLAALLLAAGLVVGWGVASLTNDAVEASPEAVRVSVPVPGSIPILHPRLTADGRTVLFSGRDLDDRAGGRIGRLYIRHLDEDAVRPIEGTDDLRSFALSPDGRSIAFVVEDDRGGRNRLMRVPVDQSTPPQHLADFGTNLRDVRWLDADTLVTFDSNDQSLWRFPATGGPPESPLEVTGDPAPFSVQAREALPDGRHLLVRAVSFDTGVYQQYIGVVDTETGKLSRVVEDGSWPQYLDSGHLVFSRADQLMAAPFDSKRLEVTGPAQVLLGDLWAEGGYAGGHYSVSERGHLAFLKGGVQGADRRIVFVDPQGNLIPWSDHRTMFTSLHVSPNGKWFAATVDNTAEGDPLLQVRASEMDVPRFVTVGSKRAFDCSLPFWSTDSRLLAYTCVDQNVVQVYVADPSRPGSARQILEQPADVDFELAGFFLDDSRLLAKWEDGERAYVISFPVDPEDGAAPVIETLPTEEPDLGGLLVSRDGRWVLYYSQDTGRLEIYVRELIDARTLGPRASLGFEAPNFAYWSHDFGSGDYELMVGLDERHHEVRISTRPSLRVGTPARLDLNEVSLGIVYMETLPEGRFLGIHQPISELGASELSLILNWRQEFENRSSD